MQIQDFNITKERQQKEINVAIQTVKSNPFSEEVKSKFSSIGEAVVNGINAQRAHVYKELEDFNFEDKYDHTSDSNEGVDVKKVQGDSLNTRTIQHSISEALSKIINELSSENASSITGPMNNKLNSTKQQFDEFNGQMIKGLKEMIDTVANAYQEPEEEPVEENKNDGSDINPEDLGKKEGVDIDEDVEYELKAEDFDNNPDLAKQGFNIGDKVKVSFKDEQQKAFNNSNPPQEEEKQQYFPKGGATAIPQEEIEEGNKKETKSSRKKK